MAPMRVWYCHSVGNGSAPHCFLKTNVLLPTLERPKSNTVCRRCTARSSRCQYKSEFAQVELKRRRLLELGTSVTPQPCSSKAAANGLSPARTTHNSARSPNCCRVLWKKRLLYTGVPRSRML